MIRSEAVGVDVGGTSIKAVLADHEGRVLVEKRALTPSPDPSGTRVCAVVSQLLSNFPASAALPVGIVVPGIVDEQQGLAVHSSNIGWRDVPLASRLSSTLGRPVGFGHDVRAGALAESRWGAAVGELGVVAFVPIGTGIAAGILVDGQPLAAEGWAGEIGQMRIGEGPHTGQHVEHVASAAGTARRAGEPNARRVAERLHAGDPLAREVWDETVAVLAEMLANLSVVVGSRVIVLGGGLALAGDALLGPLDRALRERLEPLRVPQLRPALLGDRAAALGASIIAREV